MRISDVLAGKASQEVFTVGPDTSVRELLRSLARNNIGAVIVSSDGRSVDGIVSERDVVRRLLEDDALLDSAVSSIMTTDVRTCEPGDEVTDMLRLMTARRFRHLPVVTDGRLTGVISIGDVVKSRMEQLEFERDQLDSYVHTAQT